MSTQPHELAEDVLEAFEADLNELLRRRHDRPIDFHRPYAYQRSFHEATEKERWFVAGNRSGKTLSGAAEVVNLVTGRAEWWKGEAGEVWCGAVSLADSEAVQRPAVRKLLPPGDILRWTRERDGASESTLYLRNGWVVRFKATNQGRERWQGGEVALCWFDEEPPGDVFDEGYARTVSCAGRIIVTFTPLNGLVWKEGYERVYEPWLAFRRAHPNARHGTVAPGLHVTTAAMSDNPSIPRDEIRALRARYAHRPLLLRVRDGGEWLDTSEDQIIPVEKFREWSMEPRDGYRDMVAWIDPAYSAKTASCRSSIAVAARTSSGDIHVLESEGGRWEPDERERRCLEVLARHGHPNCYVQRVGGDMEFANALNGALMRAGHRACVLPWPQTGPVPDKVTRANTFAPMVAAGQVHLRPEHQEVRRQAAVFSASYLKAGGVCDDLDAVMGAVLRLVEGVAPPGFHAALRAADLPPVGSKDRARDDAHWGDDLDDDLSWRYDGDPFGEVD